jgi:outer membrane lipoprotein-sorting protein
MSTSPWDRASNSLPLTAAGRRRPERVSLPEGTPSVAELFTFARDAELRFETLRMRLEDRTATTNGERLLVIETTLRHPGEAKVVTTDPSQGIAANHELWISDGHTVRTWSAEHRKGTERRARPRVVGLDDPDFPGSATVYRPLTALPAESLADSFIHPAGLCQNVLATGRTWVSSTVDVNGREAVVLECDHPRSIGIAADRPDHHIQVSFDRDTGVILRLVETIAGEVTREAAVTSLLPDAALSPAAFAFTFPSGATLIY